MPKKRSKGKKANKSTAKPKVKKYKGTLTWATTNDADKRYLEDWGSQTSGSCSIEQFNLSENTIAMVFESDGEIYDITLYKQTKTPMFKGERSDQGEVEDKITCVIEHISPNKIKLNGWWYEKDDDDRWRRYKIGPDTLVTSR